MLTNWLGGNKDHPSEYIDPAIEGSSEVNQPAAQQILGDHVQGFYNKVREILA